MGSMDCERVSAEEIPERYLQGTLSDTDREVFELHYFECDRCFERVRALEAAQSELRRTPPVVTGARQSAVGPSAWIAAAAVVVAAAGLAFWAIERNQVPRPQTSQETSSVPA